MVHFSFIPLDTLCQDFFRLFFKILVVSVFEVLALIGKLKKSKNSILDGLSQLTIMIEIKENMR